MYKFKKNVNIGNLEAENDDLLLDSFVEKDELLALRDVNNHKCIILGRTGSGKSALIRYIETNEPNVKRIEPEQLSIRHLSNSSIISYFRKDLEIKLDLFYKVLWKHVFIVELIKLHYGKNLSKADSFLDWFKGQFKRNPKNERRNKAIEYLEKWEDEFWAETEYRIKEIATNLEERFNNELTGSLTLKEILGNIGAEAKSGTEISNSKNVTAEILHKAQKVVNESQLEEIIEIQKILCEIFSKTQKKYYIVVDDLDKNWVDTDIEYDLIKALVEVIKDFRKIPNTKLIIALRTNILQKIFYKNSTKGVQREKYKYLYLNIEWTRIDLTTLINNRLSTLMRGTYTKDSPKINELLPKETSKLPSGFDYILDRTLLRPRDVISYFNLLIEKSNGKTQISREKITKSEREYSLGRLQALDDEWLENYGDLSVIYNFLKKGPISFTLEDIKEQVGEYIFNAVANNELKDVKPEIQKMFSAFVEDEELNVLPVLKKMLIILYEVGIIGIKLSPEYSLDFISTSVNYNKEDLDNLSKFSVHKMLYKALRIRERKNKSQQLG